MAAAGNPRILAVNLSTYTLSASGAVDANFPLSNLQTYLARDKAQTTINTSQQFIIDFGIAITCDTIVLQNHNVTALILFSMTLEWSSNGTTWTAGPDLTFISDPGWVEFAPQTFRYWRLNYNVVTATAPPYIGNWFLGKRFDFGAPYDFGYGDGGLLFETSEAKALDGTLRMAQSYGGRKMWKIDFAGSQTRGGISDAVKTNWRTAFAIIRGKLRPFYYLDTDGTTLNYVHFDIDKDSSMRAMYNINNLQGVLMKSQLVF